MRTRSHAWRTAPGTPAPAALLAGLTTLALAAVWLVARDAWPAAAAILVGTLLLSRPLLARAAPPVEPSPTAERTVPPLATPRPECHPVSGLQTREPLIARMARDGRGTLGVVAFADYDRLCAFDPQAGDRVLRVLAGRVRAMLPPSRVIAHVDRGHLAIWIDAATPPDQARRELGAAVYALGAPVTDEAGDIIPEVALRHLHVDVASEAPEVALARTISAFSVADLDAGGVQADQIGRARDRYHLEQDLRQAVARGELRLAYQPLIDADERRVCGAEALLRWRRGGETVPPSLFVPIMEAAGLSREIGLWVLNTAMRQAADWSAAGLSSLRVAVNVSGAQMADDDLAVVIDRTLARHDLAADALEVELTESVALGDTAQAARLVETLRSQGIAVAIDDFGTGFSSLSTMRRLRFDKIKIDREFVTDVHLRPESQAICQSILALGRGLGTRVLAEGVEQQAEVDWLHGQGCRYFQGYRFAEPLSADAFAVFAADTTRLSALLPAPASRRGARAR